MAINSDRLAGLIFKNLIRNNSEEDQKTLDQWLDEDEKNRLYYNYITDPKLLQESFDLYNEFDIDVDRKWYEFRSKIPDSEPIRFSNRRYWMKLTMAVAATVLLIILTGLWNWFKPSNKKETSTSTKYRLIGDVDAGKDGAILSLADGQQIALDTAINGFLALQGRSQIRKINGQLLYTTSEFSASTTSASIQYNTLFTPRARQFQLTLPDGSRLWLNAASFVKYPTQFNGSERRIEVSGEVYLEVTEDSSKPFIVETDSVSIEVLGTKFNVNTYNDDGYINTTLIEGKVKIVSGSSERKLTPGQQARVNNYKITIIPNIDVDQVIAWKNGFISLNDVELKIVLKQISRWYNVKIEDKVKLKVPEITGTIPRTFKLSEALKSLEINTGLVFTINGNTVRVEDRK